MDFRAVIFDLDGTLLDSMGVWESVDIGFLARRGIEVPTDYAKAVSALNLREAAEYTIKRFLLPDTTEALIEEWSGMALHEYTHNVMLKPYAGEYLEKLRACGVRLGIATGSSGLLFEPALRNNGIHMMFDVISATADTVRGKEYPDIYLHTAAQLGVQPGMCLVYEDIPQAIRSAKQAGMTVYGVYDKFAEDHWEEIESIADGTLYDFRQAPLPLPFGIA